VIRDSRLENFETAQQLSKRIQWETENRAITESSMRRCFFHPAHSALQALRHQPATGPLRKLFQNGFHTTIPRPAAKLKTDLERRIEQIPIERFRNFCIVAHVDHGKSTLSDRLLELTGTIEKGGLKQSLDRLDVERERGITVKANTCSMVYNHNGEDYLLHLVDTPGHVDFRAEVSRSYASCGGALLLVDASQGVQAQTVANFYLAFAQDLTLVPVLNKVDLPTADKQRTLDQLRDTFEIDSSNAVAVSAKSGLNVEKLLPVIVDQIPAPTTDDGAPLKLLLVDSWYDNYKGVILLVRIFDGTIKPGDKVISFATGITYTVGEVGIMYPLQTPQTMLRAGQVGYVYFNPGMKRSKDAKIGDTFTTLGNQDKVKMLPGFEEPKSMVFVSAFPTDQGDYAHLEDSIHQVTLNDRSVSIMKESSEALGAGWRMGFLGTLHCSVFEDRLRQEHGASIIITPPSVPFKIIRKDGTEEIMTNPNSFPDGSLLHQNIIDLQEPYITATITMPEEYLGTVIEMCEGNRGQQDSLTFFTATQVILKYKLPLERLVDDFFGKLKSATKGYASLDYEDAGFRSSAITKLQLHVNKVPVDAVARVVHTSQAERLGKEWVTKFTKHVDRQMFEVVIQAVTGKKVVARETLKPFRKDVTAKLHAADIGRRRKLLDRQKEGRKKLRAVGNVVIDNKAFQSFLAK
jgi:elongation factor 4